MRFLTSSQCRRWTKTLNVDSLVLGATPPVGIHTLRCHTPYQQPAWFSRIIVNSLGSFSWCLLWTGDEGVWPSAENLHLYYRLRQSYGDLRLLGEANGHLFMVYETADIASYVQLSLMSLWDADLLTDTRYMSVRLSHEGIVEFRTDNPSHLEEMLQQLEAAKVEGIEII